MGGRFRISNTQDEPRGSGLGRILLVVVLLLIIATIIFVTKQTPPTPNPSPRSTARGQ